MSKAWDKAEEEVRTGVELHPNAWFKACLDELEPGRIFIPGAGEGRSAVYAALQGWEVHAYDRSQNQQRKAMLLAEERGVELDYQLGDLDSILLEEAHYDAVAPLFVQLPPIPRKKLHAHLMKGLKGGGHWIMEAFSKEQIAYSSGGPPDIDRLYSLSDIERELDDLELLSSIEEEVELMEGERDLGVARVLRVFAKKAVPS